MVALQRLGMKTAYAGRFGSDDAGMFGRESLANEDVNLKYAETIKGATNQLAFIIIDARSGERTIIWDRDERLSYGPDEVPRSEEHTSELQSQFHLVCRLLLEKKNKKHKNNIKK